MLSELVTKILVIALSVELVQLEIKEPYELEPDDLIKSIIGDIYKARTSLDRATTSAVKNKDHNSERDAGGFSKIVNRTKGNKARRMIDTEQADLNVTTPKLRHGNITLKQIKMRRMRMYVEQLLNNDYSAVPNFDNGDDDPARHTRRFDSMRDAGIPTSKFKPVRRAVSKFLEYNPEALMEKKMKIFGLMQQFVYHIRYFLPIAQLLRKKYYKTHEYRLGFLLCTYRIVWQHMRRLGSSLVYFFATYPNLYVLLKTHERMVRFHVDEADTYNLIRRLAYEKTIKEDPTYYDHSLEL